MRGILVRFVITAIGLWLATSLVPDVYVRDAGVLFWAALWLGLVNALVRPVVVLLTLPFTLLTLGGFLLVVNAGMVSLVAWLIDGLVVDGFWAALFSGIVVSLTSWIAAAFVGGNGRYERLVMRG